MNTNKKPIIIQSNYEIILEVNNPEFKAAQTALSTFSELIKSPNIFHTYKISKISIWNACALNIKIEFIQDTLKKYSRYPVPKKVNDFIVKYYNTYGKFKLFEGDKDKIILYCKDAELLKKIKKHEKINKYIIEQKSDNEAIMPLAVRGLFKQDLISIGYPVEDFAGYEEGDEFSLDLKENDSFKLRDYQKDAMQAFHMQGSVEGGAGVIVLPCGGGKTIVGMGIMSILQTETLIITPNIVAIRQWKKELQSKTTIKKSDIGEYAGEKKEIKPVTIATYNILTYRKSKNSDFKHFKLFEEKNWGLIIYDEIHLLPAPVFRKVSELQAKRRLGLTATLLREDGKEKEVFSLIGPKKFDLPWKNLESMEYIAKAYCFEVKVDLISSEMERYIYETNRKKYRISAENPNKLFIIEKITAQANGHNILIIGEYINQLQIVADHFKIPLITGKTPNETREKLYNDFRTNKIKKLVVSRVANFAIDLPDANLAIQISGTFGSRQEEAQRLGRILRPKKGENKAFLFNVVTAHSLEEHFAENRKRFLLEQGYIYNAVNEENLDDTLEQVFNKKN